MLRVLFLYKQVKIQSKLSMLVAVGDRDILGEESLPLSASFVSDQRGGV